MISLPYQKYKIGQCVINCHDMTISIDAQTISLPAKVFEFLKLLILHSEKTVTKELAIEEVWLGNIEVGKRGTGNAIWQLRKALTDLGVQPEEYFKTITKVGYQLLIPPIPLEVSSSNSIPAQASTNTRWLTPLLIACCCAIAVLVYLSWSDVKAPPLNTITKVPSRITNYEGVEEQAAISPDGRHMAFQWRRENAKGLLFIKDLVNQDAPLRQISMSSELEGAPSWSPDGQSLAYFRLSAEGTCSIHVRDLITNQDKLIDSGCATQGYLKGLEWSPDGTKLAYAKTLADSSPIFIYEFSRQTIQQFSSPKAGERDLLMTWAADSQQLAFVRSQENMRAEIMLRSLGAQQAESIISNEKLIIGLDWDNQDDALYFTALREANFVIQKFNFADLSLTPFHQDETISSLTIDETSNSLFYSRHISQEFITQRSLTDGRITRQLASSSRDLYGQYFAATNELIFLSNRSGAWELWLKTATKNVMLTDNLGLVTIPATSPTNSQYVVPININGTDHNALYIGDTKDMSLKPITAISGNVRYASFSNDGTQIYYSVYVDNDWGLYRYDLATETIHLILKENVKYAIEDDNKGLYYTKDHQPGIYYLSADGTTNTQVTTNLRAQDWGSFLYQNGALYFLQRTDKNDLIVCLDNNGKQSTAFMLPAVSIRNERSLAAGSDNTIIVSMLGINDADIFQVPLSASKP